MKDFLLRELIKNKLFIKYTLVGLVATVLEVVIIFILADFFNYWYLTSCSIAYLFSFSFSFVFRKFWVFKDKDFKKFSKQVFWYFIFLLFSTLLNAVFVSILVEKFFIHYILAQLISGFFLGFLGFTFNKTVTFKPFKEVNMGIYDNIIKKNNI